jgi:hypothetical protein
MTMIPMWPQVKDVYCGPPDMMCLLPCVIGPNTSSVHLFGDPGDDDEVRDVGAPNMAAILSTIECRTGLLDSLGLHDVRLVNDGFSETFRRLISKNARSLTSVMLNSMDPVSLPVAQDIFRLPLLRYLTMDLPTLPGTPPGIPPSLTDLAITIDSEETLARVFTACWTSRVTLLDITYVGSSSPRNWKDLTGTFASGQLAQTLTDFSWVESLPQRLDPGMLQTFLPFTNLQSLKIDTSCWGVCVFTFGHVEVCELSSALPNLRTLYLGGDPCGLVTTSVSFVTLVIISKHCKHLESLRIHFDPADIVALDNTEEPSAVFADNGEGARSECALETLNVGNTQMVGEEGLLSWHMALALLEIFPRLSVIEHAYPGEIWLEVRRRLQRCRDIKRFVGDM